MTNDGREITVHKSSHIRICNHLLSTEILGTPLKLSGIISLHQFGSLPKLGLLNTHQWCHHLNKNEQRTNLSEAANLSLKSTISASAAESLSWQAASASWAALTLNSRLCSSKAFLRASAWELALCSDSLISVTSLKKIPHINLITLKRKLHCIAKTKPNSKLSPSICF